MAYKTHADKLNAGARRKYRAPDGMMAGTTMAGAIVGGTIGAFTGGPVVTVAGMALGALAARTITRYAHDESTTDESPAV